MQTMSASGQDDEQLHHVRAGKQSLSSRSSHSLMLIKLIIYSSLSSLLLIASATTPHEPTKSQPPPPPQAISGPQQASNSTPSNSIYYNSNNQQQHQATNYVNNYEQQVFATPPETVDVQHQNITRLLIQRFSFLFNQNELAQFEQQDSLSRGQLLLDKLTLQANLSELQDELELAAERQRKQQQQQQQQQSSLETRTLSLIQSNLQKLTSINLSELNEAQQKRNYIRVLNRVFSRAELPDSFTQQRGAHSLLRTSGGGSANSGSQPTSAAGAQTTGGAHCANHIGCIAELPNFPMILKLKPNVSATFTIYTRERGHKNGQRILFEPLMHYQLREGVDAQTTMNELVLQKEVLSITKQLKLLPVVVGGGGGGNSNGGSGIGSSGSQLLTGGAASAGFGASINAAAAAAVAATATGGLGGVAGHQASLLHHHKRRNHHLVGVGGVGGAAVAASKQQASKLLSSMATSWISANKIAAAKELPFDLAALEQSSFNASLTTRVIIGGYFAKEDEEWIDELVRQWLLLEPSNVIKVSWQDSNRGLYHSAAYNSRIVGRQLSLFLHYLNELFHIDLGKFHLVGHSLGAHIAGFVGADNEGQIARITGLDPAGPIFVELPAAHRLDASDARFVDVLHTNGGTITKGALGLSTPSGHVDYYCNGGSLQPGCFFSSVTMSIMDPVERIACNHRRSYRYFTEIIKLAISEQRKLLRRNTMLVAAERSNAGAVPLLLGALPPGGAAGAGADLLAAAAASAGDPTQDAASLMAQVDDSNRFPHAFLFDAKQEDLVKLVQPELRLVPLLLDGDASLARQQQQESPAPPLKKQIEFHQLNPDFPRDKRGLYFFRTRQEAPFFASKQYALRLSLDQPIRRKITLLVKINSTLVTEVEFDESTTTSADSAQSHSLVFVPSNPNLIDHAQLFSGRSSKAPDLWLMWRQRSFNLLLAHQANELHVNSLELLLLDDSDSGGGLDNSRSYSTEQHDTTTTGNNNNFDSQELPQSDQPAAVAGPAVAPASSSSEARARNVSSAKLMRHQLGITNTYLIRYELNTLNQQQQALTGAAGSAGSGGSGGAGGSSRNEQQASLARSQQTSGGSSFVITRNQWHKFDGRPVPIE